VWEPQDGAPHPVCFFQFIRNRPLPGNFIPGRGLIYLGCWRVYSSRLVQDEMKLSDGSVSFFRKRVISPMPVLVLEAPGIYQTAVGYALFSGGLCLSDSGKKTKAASYKLATFAGFRPGGGRSVGRPVFTGSVCSWSGPCLRRPGQGLDRISIGWEQTIGKPGQKAESPWMPVCFCPEGDRKFGH